MFANFFNTFEIFYIYQGKIYVKEDKFNEQYSIKHSYLNSDWDAPLPQSTGQPQ